MGSSALEKANRISTGIDKKDRQERQKVFRLFDVNGNSYLSLAEIDKGMRDVLELPELFEAKPVLIRAYQASKDKVQAKHTFGDDYVSKAEFRFLLIYLKLYYNIWIEFERLDIGGQRKLDEAQFVNGIPYYKGWGIKLKDAKKTFSDLKAKHNAQDSITFTEFSDWLIQEHLKQYPNNEIHEDLD